MIKIIVEKFINSYNKLKTYLKRKRQMQKTEKRAFAGIGPLPII
jgi:hypothetical protein